MFAFTATRCGSCESSAASSSSLLQRRSASPAARARHAHGAPRARALADARRRPVLERQAGRRRHRGLLRLVLRGVRRRPLRVTPARLASGESNAAGSVPARASPPTSRPHLEGSDSRPESPSPQTRSRSGDGGHHSRDEREAEIAVEPAVEPVELQEAELDDRGSLNKTREAPLPSCLS